MPAKIGLSRFDVSRLMAMGFFVMGVSGALDALDLFRNDAASGAGKTGKLARAICDGYAGNPAIGKAVDVAYNGYDAPLQYGCGPYWGGPDGYDAPTPGGNEVPFTGGQCTFDYDVELSDAFIGNYFRRGVRGPICGVEEIEGGSPGSPTFTVVIRHGSNCSDTTFGVAGPESRSPTIVSVTPSGGQPDTCGDPPAAPVPSVPGNPPPGTGFGIPRDIGDPGEPFIVTPRVPDFSRPGEPVIVFDTPGGPIAVSPTNPDPGLPPAAPELGPPQDVDGAGDVDVDPESESEGVSVLGYRFFVRDNAPQFQSVIPGTSPRVYSRVIGSIQLKLKGESGTFYSDNLQMTSQEGSIVKQHPTLQVVGCAYNVLPNLAGLTLYEIRGRDDDS